MRVLLADPQSDVRYALRVLLQLVRELNAEVVAEANDAPSLYRILESSTADLLLIDWSLPNLPAEDRLASIRQFQPDLRIIVLSGRPEFKQAALDAGADDFVSKIDSVDPLITAIRTIAKFLSA